MKYVSLYHSKLTDNKMADIYDNICGPTKPNTGKKEVICNYPTCVVSGEDVAARRLEMTPNPAYRTIICSEECVSSM